MTYNAIAQRRDMIGLLVYRPGRHVIGIAIVAVLTFFGNTRVKKGLCWLERISGGVANDAVLGCR